MMNMRTRLFATVMAVMLLLSSAISAEARRPHRRGAGCYRIPRVEARMPLVRTIKMERTTTVNKTSRPERKLMAVAYLQRNLYLTVKEYCGITNLDKRFAEAELDSFTLDKKDPLVRKVQGKKVIYTLADDRKEHS